MNRATYRNLLDEKISVITKNFIRNYFEAEGEEFEGVMSKDEGVGIKPR